MVFHTLRHLSEIAHSVEWIKARLFNISALNRSIEREYHEKVLEYFIVFVEIEKLLKIKMFVGVSASILTDKK